MPCPGVRFENRDHTESQESNRVNRMRVRVSVGWEQWDSCGTLTRRRASPSGAVGHSAVPVR